MRSKTIFAAFIFLVIASLLSACQQMATPQVQELTRIRLPMGYIPNVQYAPFYIAADRGYYAEAGLEVEFDYSLETDGVALVGANELPFALVSGEQVLLARAQGIPVVYVMAWWQDYPVAVTSLKEAGINGPQDLKGKRVGIPGPYGASYVGLQALLRAADIQESEVTLDSIGFNQVEALIAGQEDAVVIYANNEPIQLAERGYEVDTIRVADWVHLASNGLITNETTIAEDPELVQRMVRATLRGVAEAVADPQAAYITSQKFIEGLGDDQIQRKVLEASVEFWKTEQPGVTDLAAWQNMQDVLLQMGLITQPLDLEKAYSNEFVR